MLFMETIAVYCENHMKHTNTLCGKNAGLFYVTAGGTYVGVAFPISYFPICSTTKRIFLGWVKEVRTTKS
jgi:hypothetical protein